MVSQDEVQLNLKYKGPRNYIHGSDIYNAVNSKAEEITGMQDSFVSKLAFRRFARKDCNLCLIQPVQTGCYVAKGTIGGTRQNHLQPFWIVESDTPPVGRYEFDEESIIDAKLMTDRDITLYDRTVYTPIEEVIALTKALNYKLLPDVSGKWFFGQLDLAKPFSVYRNKLTIAFKTAKSHRFTLSQIYEDNVFIGDIRFIVGEP